MDDYCHLSDNKKTIHIYVDRKYNFHLGKFIGLLHLTISYFIFIFSSHVLGFAYIVSCLFFLHHLSLFFISLCILDGILKDLSYFAFIESYRFRCYNDLLESFNSSSLLYGEVCAAIAYYYYIFPIRERKYYILVKLWIWVLFV